MNARTLLRYLRAAGVNLTLGEDERLHVDAPAGVFSENLRRSLVESKEVLVDILRRERRKLEKADRRGLDICWSEYPVWIKLHNPLTGEWHEVRASACLPGVVEAANRKRTGKRNGRSRLDASPSRSG